MTCPGPMYKGKRLNNYAQNMQLKKVNGHKDGLTWRCHKVHCITTEKGQYKVKDVKVSIQHETWMSDSNLSLEVITELVYLWSQRLSNSAIQHELQSLH